MVISLLEIGKTKPTCAIDKNILVSTRPVFRPSALSILFKSEAGRHNFNLPEFTTEGELRARFTSTV